MRDNWVLKSNAPQDFVEFLDQELEKLLENHKSSYNYSNLANSDLGVLSQLLWSRSVLNKDELEKFLFPSYGRDVYDPFLLKDMGMAVDRVIKAILAGDKIAVYADYDADGICAAAILAEFLNAVGVDFDVFQPDRIKDTFGLGVENIKSIHKQGMNLLITLDCGTTDKKEINFARSLGLDVIVIDHHLPQRDSLPRAYALINPHQKGDNYPYKYLSGAGLAFKFVQGMIMEMLSKTDQNELGRRAKKLDERWLLDLVAIAAIADVVPLMDENRVLASFGIEVLKKMRRPGIFAMLSGKNTSDSDITEETIGYYIAPRINAASRMDSPKPALDLLLSKHPLEAAHLAKYLEEKNNERKEVVEKMISSLEAVFSKTKVPKIIFAGSKSWSAGVIGLAASRLVQRYQRPVFLYANQGEIAKGSCRAPEGVDVVELMGCAKDYFSDFGGHKSSGGFSFEISKLGQIKRCFLELENNFCNSQEMREEIKIDAQINTEEINFDTYKTIRSLAPFGQGNSLPRFLLKKVKVSGLRKIGRNGQYLKMLLGNNQIPAVYFGKPDELGFIYNGGYADVVCEIVKDSWNGYTSVQLRIIDMDPLD